MVREPDGRGDGGEVSPSPGGGADSIGDTAPFSIADSIHCRDGSRNSGESNGVPVGIAMNRKCIGRVVM